MISKLAELMTPFTEIAIVSESKKVTFDQAKKIARAIHKQVNGEFYSAWSKKANVKAYQNRSDAPKNCQFVIIKDDIGEDALGFHDSVKGIPYAYVLSSININDVSVTCSHEILEMLADPTGNSFRSSGSIIPEQKMVQYLVEVCDPVESQTYLIDEVSVSNFITPQYYSNKTDYLSGLRLSPGGYVSWMKTDGEWWQAFMDSDGSISFSNLGKLSRAEGESWHGRLDRLPEPVKK